MWPNMVQFRSATSEISWRKKEEETLVKYKFAGGLIRAEFSFSILRSPVYTKSVNRMFIECYVQIYEQITKKDANWLFLM